MSDKRSVATDALETLGNIIGEGCGRDAIHLAVEPCIAGEILHPGEHIGIKKKRAYKGFKKLGIVDPFLKDPVQVGERFWLIVYPRQITSLRHVWTHPDFEEAVKKTLTKVEESEEWIKKFANDIRQHPDSLMNAADRWVASEDYTYDNSESYKKHWDKFPEFWDHYEIVRGEKVDCEKESFFTCSC